MGQVFDSQFQAMYDGFARRGTFIETAYAPNGRVDYVYERDRLLASTDALGVVRKFLPWVEVAEEQPDVPTLRVLSIENRRGRVQPSVPQALDLIDAELGNDNPALHGGFPLVTPVHMVHLNPNGVNLSAGSYTRKDWLPLSFSAFDAGGVTLVCAAGNDAVHRKFWPAAFDWAVGSGASFATPLVAGLIAAEMSRNGLTAADATQAVLARARANAIPGVGPALYPR